MVKYKLILQASARHPSGEAETGRRDGRDTQEALARLHSGGSLNRSHACTAGGRGSFAAPTGQALSEERHMAKLNITITTGPCVCTEPGCTEGVKVETDYDPEDSPSTALRKFAEHGLPVVAEMVSTYVRLFEPSKRIELLSPNSSDVVPTATEPTTALDPVLEWPKEMAFDPLKP